MAVNTRQPPPQKADKHRQLRIVAILSFILALGLLLPCGILWKRVLPAIGIAPMFFSAAFNIMTVGGQPRLPKSTVLIHLFLAAFLLGILIPTWIQMDNGYATMLGTYGTMPMIVNFIIHIYLAFATLPYTSWFTRSVPVCCCNNPSGCLRPSGLDIFVSRKEGSNEAQQPILSFCDNNARPSSEFLTSGFNTPRVSQDTLQSSNGRSEQSADLV